MKIETPFGIFFTGGHVPARRVAVILRALEWTASLAERSGMWSRVSTQGGVALERIVNGKQVHLYPLIAAKQDCGDFSNEYSRSHLPISVNARNICVTLKNKKSQVPHCDMVACCVLLLSPSSVPQNQLPSTLRNALFTQSGYFRGGRWYQEESQAVLDFRREVETDEEATAFIMAHPDAWEELRDELSWRDYPETTLHFVNEMLSGAMDEDDIDNVLWALRYLRGWDEEAFQHRLEPWLDHPNPLVARYALENLHLSSPQHAQRLLWRRCYRDDLMAWNIHQRLQEWPELHEELVRDTVDMVEYAQNEEFRLKALAWVSHFVDMDATIRALIAEEHDFDRLRELLWKVNTNGPWLEDLAMTYIKAPLQSLRLAFVEATAKNRSFDPYPFWRALMDDPKTSGQVRQRILQSLDRVTHEQGLAFLEEGMDVNLRFVQKAALHAMKGFEHTEIEHLLNRGLTSHFTGVKRLAREVAGHFGMDVGPSIEHDRATA